MSSKPRLLVAEDDSDIREIIRTRLLMAGYEVDIARTGIEAFNRASEYRPAGMVLDINMPEIDGFEVLRRLQATPKGIIPTLVLTARHSADDVRTAIDLGAKDYLSKPFSEGQLLARVSRLMRRA